MGLFKEDYLLELRLKLSKEAGHGISDKDWEKVIEDVEKPIIEKLQKELPKAIMFSLYDAADRGDVIIEIDGMNVKEELDLARGIMASTHWGGGSD